MQKSIVDDAVIEWSEIATVFIGTRAFNPFQAHSYVARVTLPDATVIVALRPGDAVKPASDYADEVAYEARIAAAEGEATVAL